MSAVEQTADPTLDEALRLAQRGLRVLPIKPGQKRPPMPAWQDAATTDPTTITNWWTHLYRDHGVGVATGHASGVFVLDVDVAGTKAGDDTLHALEQTHGPLPETVETLTGSGGRHIWFRWPGGADIRNDAGSRLGPGLDIRGEGGQVLAPPTVHPNGQHYQWLADHAPGDLELADAPRWLLNLLTAPPAPPQPAERAAGIDDGPAARFNNTHTWDELLAADGWTLDHTDRDGEQHWVRPGKDPRQGTSATVGYKGGGALVVFTSSVAWLPAGAYSRFGYYAARQHDGDRSAAARTLLSAEPRPDTDLSWVDTAPIGSQTVTEPDGPQAHGWERVQLSDYRGPGYIPPIPTVLARTDQACLFYPERMNALQGESGSGKTWVSLAAVREVLLAGGTAILVDLEDHPRSIDDRLRSLGVPDDIIDTRFIYLRPDVAIGPEALDYVDALIVEHQAAIVVIDSVGEAMALQGLKQNDDDEVARWMRKLARRWARLGPAVILIDHVVKDAESRGLYAIGSQRKRAAIDGAAYRVDQIKAFSKTQNGLLKLVVAKDRNGTYPNGSTAAEITVESSGGEIALIIRPAVSVADSEGVGGVKHTVLAERISRWLEIQPSPQSKTATVDTVEGKAVHLRSAFEELLASSYLERVDTVKGYDRYRVAKPFRTDDPAHILASEGVSTPSPVERPTPSPSPSHKTAGQSHHVPPRPTPSPTPEINPVPPRPNPPLRGGGRDGVSRPPEPPAPRRFEHLL